MCVDSVLQFYPKFPTLAPIFTLTSADAHVQNKMLSFGMISKWWLYPWNAYQMKVVWNGWLLFFAGRSFKSCPYQNGSYTWIVGEKIGSILRYTIEWIQPWRLYRFQFLYIEQNEQIIKWNNSLWQSSSRKKKINKSSENYWLINIPAAFIQLPIWINCQVNRNVTKGNEHKRIKTKQFRIYSGEVHYL